MQPEEEDREVGAVEAEAEEQDNVVMASSNGTSLDQQLEQIILCYAETIYRTNGVWEGPNPLSPILPLFIVQMTVAILATRLLVLVLKYFNQPPFVAEILVSSRFLVGFYWVHP